MSCLSWKFEVAFPNSTPMCWIINENNREPLHTFQYLKYVEIEITENLLKTLTFRIEEIMKTGNFREI